MIDQTMVNAIMGVFCVLLGFILKVVWDSVKDLQKADTELALRVSEVEILIAGDYAKREDVTLLGKAIFEKLDKIDTKLDTKISRDDCLIRHGQ